MTEELKIAMDWLAGLEVNSEFEESSKEIILNTLEEDDSKLHAQIDSLLDQLEELYQLEQAKEALKQNADIADERNQLLVENKKQAKQIDLMAGEIEEYMQENVYHFLHICDKCKLDVENCHGDFCRKTIIEYFEKEAENEK